MIDEGDTCIVPSIRPDCLVARIGVLLSSSPLHRLSVPRFRRSEPAQVASNPTVKRRSHYTASPVLRPSHKSVDIGRG